MAKKTEKITRAQHYREILDDEGINLDDCRVLAFVFKECWPNLFHFALMLNVPRPVYYLFDCWEHTAYVIAPENDKNTAIIIAIAERYDGEQITPNLR